MGKENIEKYSARYALLKHVMGFWHDHFFYRKIIVLGRENINPDDYVIFAPNHQNALLDALAVLFTHKGQPVFLARADIFKKKFVASILYFLKILPVYRLRDGFSSLKSNDEIFQKTIDVIKNRNGLVILPEGNHEGFRRLRQLKKGICRISFQADEATGFNLKIKIIPVGIEFSNYSRYRQVLTVVYGTPIDTSEYLETYRDNHEKALNDLRDRLSAEMKRIMVHIEPPDHYEAIDELRSIINGKYSDDIKFPKLFRDRNLIEKLNKLKDNKPDLFERICHLSLEIKQKSNDLNISYKLLAKKKNPLGWILLGVLGLIVTVPIWLFGNIFTLTFLTLPELEVRRVKDLQFHGSMRFAVSFLLALVFLPLFLVLSLLIFSEWWIALIIFAAIPLSGLFAWNYNMLFRRILGGFRVRKYINEGNPEYLSLKKNYTELIKLISGLKDEEK